MRAKMEKSSSGFTIIEIIFLVAIAGLVLEAIGSLLYYTIKAEKNNENVLMAASLAQDVMERLRSVPYSKLKEKEEEEEILLPKEIGEDKGLSLVDFYEHYKLYVSSLPPPPSLDNLPQVRDLSKIIKLSEDEKGMEVVVEIRWKELPKELPKDDPNELPEDDPNERSYRVATYFLEGGLNDYLSPAPTP